LADIFDLADLTVATIQDVYQYAADQITDVNRACGEFSTFLQRDLNQRPGQQLGIGDRVHSRKLENYATFMKPMISEAVFAALRIIFSAEPETLALRELFREIGKDLGEHFATAPLRTQNAGNNDVFTGYWQGLGLRRV
jgi:hypothetical protein